jgi:hypothetical protein
MYLNRFKAMKWKQASLWVIAIVALGCGGSDERALSSISGIVTDTQGNLVRDARVWVSDKGTVETRSNSSGAFTLQGVKEGLVRVQSEVVVNNVAYYGENIMDAFGNERSKSLNIILGRKNQMATLSGYVNDRYGQRLRNARIYANVNGLGSMLAVSDDDGWYTMPALHPNLTYEVYATGLGYNSDKANISLSAGEKRRTDWVLSDATDGLLPAPQNFWAQAWTSPAVDTKSKGVPTVSLKDLFSPIIEKKKFGKVRNHQAKTSNKTRLTSGGNWIEVDLSWDPVRANNHIGYGVYRGTSANGPTTGIEYIRDTLTSFFADADPNLVQNRTYYYEITALNTNYPDTNNSESDFSDRYGVLTLGDMTLRPIQQNPLRFNWNTAQGATEYTVFIFSEYPSYAVTPFWPEDGNNAEFNAATTTGTSLTYNGPGLVKGRTYWYVVLGHTNNLDSVTISPIASFVAN